MLDVTRSLGENLVTAHLDMHTRFPVAERPGDPQTILGYVNFKDLVALMRLSVPHEASLRAVLRPMPTLGDDLVLTACLERMIREHTHIAVVRQSAGKVVGMITLEDILEELVGDIQDEYDRLPVHAVPSGWAWVVGGGLALPRLKELTGLDLASQPPGQRARGRGAERQRLDSRPLATAGPRRRHHPAGRSARRGPQSSPPEGAGSPIGTRRRGHDRGTIGRGIASDGPCKNPGGTPLRAAQFNASPGPSAQQSAHRRASRRGVSQRSRLVPRRWPSPAFGPK